MKKCLSACLSVFLSGLLILLFSPLSIHAADETQTREDNPLWGYRCLSADNQAVINIAIRHNQVVSVIVLPSTENQIISARGISLKEVGPGIYSRLHRTMLTYELTYEVIFSQKDNIHNIQVTHLTENSMTALPLDCTPLFQKRTTPAITM